MKRSNLLSGPGQGLLSRSRSRSLCSHPLEIAKFKREAFSTFANGKRKYQQAAAYILMLNTGTSERGELLGLLNSDIDLERRVLHLERGVKEVWRRDGSPSRARPGREGRQAEIGHQQADGSAERHRRRHDPGLAKGSLLRRGRAPGAGRARRLHPACEFPQAVLPNPGCGWASRKRACTQLRATRSRPAW